MADEPNTISAADIPVGELDPNTRIIANSIDGPCMHGLPLNIPCEQCRQESDE